MNVQQVLAFLTTLPWHWIALGLFVAWVAFWNIQGWLLSHRSGYFAPHLSFLPQLVRYTLGGLVGRWFIGPMKVVGWENLEPVKGGRVILAPNHQLEADVFLLTMGLRMRRIRFLMAINQTKGPLRGPLFAWMGAISVGYDKDNPARAAAESAVKVMCYEHDSTLVVFPQGMLVRDNVWDRKQFRPGIVRIARTSEQQSGQKFWILPVVATYHLDPKDATLFQRFVAALGIKRSFFGRTIYGATIQLGKPIAASDLPSSDEAAIDLYYDAMLETRRQCGAACLQHQQQRRDSSHC